MASVRFLVVDDSAPVRARLLALIREGCAAEVHEAGDAEQALAAIAVSKMNAVILDLHLGRRSGLEVLTRIKAADPSIVVIVLTNEAGEHYRRELLARGADFFLDKSRNFDRAAEIVIAIARGERAGDGTTRLS
jgi:DNA-binding NarL/FixJ family response regulator